MFKKEKYRSYNMHPGTKEILDFKNGKLIIKTSNPIWRNELSFQKNELLNKLQKAEPGLNVTEIIFR